MALTGRPGVGKTTVAVAAAKLLRSRGIAVDGFYSRELREGAARRGFELVDFSTGEREVLADVSGQGPRVGKYRVNVKGIEEFVPRIIERALASAQVVLCDEIGPMELLSPSFRRSVAKVLESSAKAIVVVHRSMGDPLMRSFARHPEGVLIEVTEENRDRLAEEIASILLGHEDRGARRGREGEPPGAARGGGGGREGGGSGRAAEDGGEGFQGAVPRGQEAPLGRDKEAGRSPGDPGAPLDGRRLHQGQGREPQPVGGDSVREADLPVEAGRGDSRRAGSAPPEVRRPGRGPRQVGRVRNEDIRRAPRGLDVRGGGGGEHSRQGRQGRRDLEVRRALRIARIRIPARQEDLGLRVQVEGAMGGLSIYCAEGVGDAEGARAMSAKRKFVSSSRYLELIMFLAALIVLDLFLRGPRALSGGVNPLDVVVMSVQLFAVMDPIAALPFYLYFEEKADEEERVRLWTTVVAAMTVLLVFFALAGAPLLQLFGVSIYSFMLGGGVLLMVLAVDIMGEGSRSLSLDPEEAAVVPLASPLLVGPGTAATLIIMSDTKPLPDLLLSLLIVIALTTLIMRFSRTIARLLGRNGIRALSRLLSIIIAGFAAQLIYQGLVGWGIVAR